jgi:ADP-heptose:LPS heptosyltransferase
MGMTDALSAYPLGGRFNHEYFRMFKEVPLMIRLRLAGRHGRILKEARSILIVNNGLIGEFVASLPAVRHLLDQTAADVDLIVSPLLEPLARGMLGIRAVYSSRSVYRRDTEGQSVRPGSFRHYDCVVVLQLSRDTYKALKDVSYKRIKLALWEYLKYLAHVSRHLAEKAGLKQLEEVLFEVLEVQRTRKVEFGDVFRFFSADYQKAASFSFLEEAAGKKIIIHTGSGWKIKLWRNERWAELIKAIHASGNFKFVFVGGTDKEAADFQEISRQLPFAVYSLVKKMDTRELALVMKHSACFIGVDSGPRHIAHLLGLPSVCLLGPGPKIYEPRDRNAVVIDRSECRCTNLFCYKSERCMDRIGVDDVLTGFAALAKDACF